MRNQYEHPIVYHTVPNAVCIIPIPEEFVDNDDKLRKLDTVVQEVNSALRAYQTGNRQADSLFESITIIRHESTVKLQIRVTAHPSALARMTRINPNWQRLRNIVTLAIPELFPEEPPIEDAPVAPEEPTSITDDEPFATPPPEPDTPPRPDPLAGYRTLRQRAQALGAYKQGMKKPALEKAVAQKEAELAEKETPQNEQNPTQPGNPKT